MKASSESGLWATEISRVSEFLVLTADISPFKTKYASMIRLSFPAHPVESFRQRRRSHNLQGVARQEGKYRQRKCRAKRSVCPNCKPDHATKQDHDVAGSRARQRASKTAPKLPPQNRHKRCCCRIRHQVSSGRSQQMAQSRAESEARRKYRQSRRSLQQVSTKRSRSQSWPHQQAEQQHGKWLQSQRYRREPQRQRDMR